MAQFDVKVGDFGILRLFGMYLVQDIQRGDIFSVVEVFGEVVDVKNLRTGSIESFHITKFHQFFVHVKPSLVNGTMRNSDCMQTWSQIFPREQTPQFPGISVAYKSNFGYKQDPQEFIDLQYFVVVCVLDIFAWLHDATFCKQTVFRVTTTGVGSLYCDYPSRINFVTPSELLDFYEPKIKEY